MISLNEQTGTVRKECFSYIRFSSLKQAKGNSEDRQLEIAPRIAKEKGWTLREDLCVENLGISAYKGSNLKIINAIIEAAQEGKISDGSVMIIEALDRLTRISVDEAYQLFRSVIKSGIEIYTDRSGRHLTKADLNNPFSLMMTVVELDAAYQYSDKLSHRVGKAWSNKRELLATEGKRLTKMAVAWVDRNTWKPIPERVSIVKKIFTLYNSGHGISSITRKLNREQVPNFGMGKSWSSSYVWQILHTRAVIGEFQPHVTKSSSTGNYYKRIKSGDAIENYYPSIIDKSVFYESQSKLGDNTKVRKTDQIGNLFSGVAYCECGAKMYLAQSNKKGLSRKYYMCWNKLKGLGCNAPSIRYEPIEHLFLAITAENAHKIFKKDSNVSDEVVMLRGKKGDIEKQIANITEYVISGNGTKALVQRQAALEKQADEIGLQLQITEAKQFSHVRKPQIEFNVISKVDLETKQAVRRKVRDFILSHVERLEFPMNREDMTLKFKSVPMGEMFFNGLDTVLTKNKIEHENIITDDEPEGVNTLKPANKTIKYERKCSK